MIDIFGILLTNWYAGCSLVGLIMLNGASELGDEKRRAELAANAIKMGNVCAITAQSGLMSGLSDSFYEQFAKRQALVDAANAAGQPVGRVN